MNSAELKKQLRASVRALEKTLSAEEKAFSDNIICKKLLSLPEYSRGKKIFCFVGTSREISTDAFIDCALADGKTVAVPLCTGPGLMKAKIITSRSELHRGAYGIPEPSDDLPDMKAEEIDLAVIPCVSCTADGIRLGQGGGYYDRFLPSVNGFKVMTVRKKLMLSDIPSEEHDIRIEQVVTD